MALCERLDLEKDTYSVSIPLGATINMGGAAITITTLTLAAAYTLGITVDVPTALLLSVVAALSACGASGVPGGSLLLIPLAALGGLLFATLGMICTALVPGIEMFNLPIFLGITPMFLFSGTFFPLQNLPGWAQQLAQLLPLTHLVKLVRGCSLQLWGGDLWLSLLYLLVGVLLLLPLAIALMVRRIVV